MYERLIVPLLTFTKAGKLDVSTMELYLEQLIKSPVRRILALGSTGEGVYLSIEVKCQIVELIDRLLPNDFEVFICPSTWAVDDFIQIMNSSNRPSNIVYLPCRYLDRDKMHAPFLRDVAKSIGNVPVYLYHLPKNTGVDFTPAGLRDAFLGVNLLGLKLSHSTFSVAEQYKNEGFEVFYGSDSDIQAALDAGCDGVVCQNLSPSFSQLNSSFAIHDVQDVCNATRSFAKSSAAGKTQALKQFFLADSDA